MLSAFCRKVLWPSEYCPKVQYLPPTAFSIVSNSLAGLPSDLIASMKNAVFLFLFAALSASPAMVRADTLELRNGTVLQGKYLGGTADTLRFETSAGLQIVDMGQVRSMNVTPPPPSPPPIPVAAPATVTLPAGTLLLVRMMDSVSSRSAPGANFTTKLEYDLVADGVAVARAGSIIYGKVQSSHQAGRAFGRSELDVRLAQMVVGGSPIPLVTSGYAQAGEASIKKVALAAGAGAVIGNNINGGGHGGGGAAWGAGIAMLKPGQTLTIPPGALLEFTLQQPVAVALGR
jgi:hypothetical protein